MYLCTDSTNKLQIYLEYFEKAYLDSTREFYTAHGQDYLAENGVQSYMRYVSATPIDHTHVINKLTVITL